MDERYKKQYEESLNWERKVKLFLESKGYSVEEYISKDESGNETYQFYIFVDGNKYPHPDFIVSKERTERYVEVKTCFDFYVNNRGNVDSEILNPRKKYLSIHKYQFDSYLQVSRWKEIECSVFFIIIANGMWFSIDIETLNSKKIYVEDAFKPTEKGQYYFWEEQDIHQLGKRIK